MKFRRSVKHKCISVLVCLCMVLTLIGMPWGTENIKAKDAPVEYLYYEWDETDKCLKCEVRNVEDYSTFVEGTIGDAAGKWYVVSGSITVDSRISVTGTANLILADGCELTVNGGINVSKGNTLNIYAQSEGEYCGRLNATAVAEDNAGIGGCGQENGGTVTINGGAVTAGGYIGAGIGGGENGAGGTVIINGGTVEAYAYDGAGIGGGRRGVGGTVTINGGTVKADGGARGAGIGGGGKGAGGTVTISGGTVTATGIYGAGIGGGYEGDDCSELNIAEGMCVRSSEGASYVAGTTKSLAGTVYVMPDCKYIDYTVNADNSLTRSEKTASELGTMNYLVGSGTTSFNAGAAYIAVGDVTVNSRISVSGTANLILADGCNLTVNGGINVSEGNTLNIYAQSEGENCGKLNVINVDGGDAGIGGCGQENGGTVTINGGIVTATGGDYAAGIGSGDNRLDWSVSGGTVTINGGTVTANGGLLGAGIGGGNRAVGSKVIINGGTVTAIGGEDGAGIGGGDGGNGGTVTISGGTVTATGDMGAGIGGGFQGAGGTVTINGGTVTATGDMGAGIGGGFQGAGGTVTINGGTVTATGDMGAGIGGGFEGDDCSELNIAEGMCVRSSEGASYVAGTTKSLVGTVYVMPDLKYIDYTFNADNSITQSEKTIDALGTMNYLVGPDTASFTDGATYIALGDVTVNSRISVSGTANLILTDGCELNVIGGINVPEGKTMNIYAQSEGENCGKLNVTEVDNNAGIGGEAGKAGGTVTINGGNVTANGVVYGAGIGGGNSGAGGTITINGGTVTASAKYGAGIGGGYSGAGGTVTINGGTVTTSGESSAAGIGGGDGGAGGKVTINGGTVTATGGMLGGAGIGGGRSGDDCTELSISNDLYIKSSKNAFEYIYGEVNSIPGSVFIHELGNWSVSGSDNVLTYSCGNSGCEKNGTPITMSLTLQKPEGTVYYTGEAWECTVSVNNEQVWEKSGYTDYPEIKYESKNGQPDLINGKPVNAGSYTATISAGNASASVDFSINQASKPAALTADEFTVKDVSCSGNTLGSISGVTSDMEYRNIESEVWTRCTDSVISELDAGSYGIRMRKNDNYENPGDELVLKVIKTPHDCSNGYIANKPATCTEDGHIEYYQCTVCKECFTDSDCKNSISDINAWLAGDGLNAKTGHSFDTENWISDEESHWHGAVCGDTDEVIDKAEHTWDDGKVTTEATCTEDGIRTFTCNVCKKTKTEKIAATGHINCQGGDHCLICDAVAGEGVSLNTDHVYAYRVCPDDAESHECYCVVCGTVLDVRGHYVLCGNPGVCVDCGATELTTTPNHDWSWDNYVNIGNEHVIYCNGCNEIVYSGEHSAYCNNPTVCIDCGATGLTDVTLLHNYDSGEYVDTGDGYTHAIYCNDCGEVVRSSGHVIHCDDPSTCVVCRATGLTGIEVIHIHNGEESDKRGFDENNHWYICDTCKNGYDYAAHTWDDGKVTKEATCTEDGVRTYTCTVCEMTKTEKIAATGHSFDTSKWTTDEESHWHAATCEHTGEMADKAAHNWDDGKVTKEATCTEDGVRTYTCTVCEKTKTEKIAATGHSFDTSKWTTDEESHWHAATCEHTGEMADKAAHSWDEGKVTKEATVSSEGTKTYTCTVCEAVKNVEIPKLTPTQAPTGTPTVTPTQAPTGTPVVTPTQAPTSTPVVTPTQTPTQAPTQVPTNTPVVTPTQAPTSTPVVTPTQAPTGTPVVTPTQAPTQVPTGTPVVTPTQAPENNTGVDVTGNQDTKPEEKVTTVTNEDGTGASIPENFIDSIKLTKSEQKAVENGAEIKLKVSADEKKATRTEKKNAQAAADEIADILADAGIEAVVDTDAKSEGTASGNTDGTDTGAGNTEGASSAPSLTVGPTYNVNMTKQVGDGEKKAVKTNGNEASFTVSVPVSENLLNTDDSKTRLYFMVSTNADGTQNVVPAKLDAENDTLSFEATGNGKVTLVTTDVPYFEEVGTELVTSAKLNARYIVTASGNRAGKTGTVAYTGPQRKKASLTVKDTVKINGITYKITSIGEGAFAGITKLKKLTVGKNITTIGAGAFKGCNNLKEIVINSKLLKAKNLSPEAFEGLRKDVVFYVPAKKIKAYTTMFKKLGVKA